MSEKFEFEAALKELEQIAAWFERPDIDLDEGLVKFERGMELAQQLKEHLAGVENRVERIRRRFDQPADTTPSE
jgi:exodeoxyribonuclease VII small subunit